MLSILLYIRNLVSWLNKWWRSVVYFSRVSADSPGGEVPCALHVRYICVTYAYTYAYTLVHRDVQCGKGSSPDGGDERPTRVLITEFMAQCGQVSQGSKRTLVKHTHTHPGTSLKDFDVGLSVCLSVCLFQGKEPKSRKFPAQKLLVVKRCPLEETCNFTDSNTSKKSSNQMRFIYPPTH